MLLQQIIKSKYNLDLVTEYRFCERRWRFDYACIEKKIAIEVEGGIFSGGRHVRGVGYKNDIEKYNKATALGWKVLRITPTNYLNLFNCLDKILSQH